MKTRYDWTQAPEGAIAGARDEDGLSVWLVCIRSRMNFEVERWVLNRHLMHPSAILDNSTDWRDSLELRPHAP